MDATITVNGISYDNFSWIFDEEHPEAGPFFVVLYIENERPYDGFRDCRELHQRQEEYFGVGKTVDVHISSKYQFDGKGVVFSIHEFERYSVQIYLWMHKV